MVAVGFGFAAVVIALFAIGSLAPLWNQNGGSQR